MAAVRRRRRRPDSPRTVPAIKNSLRRVIMIVLVLLCPVLAPQPDRQTVDLGGENEIVVRQPGDGVGREFDPHVAIALQVEIGMVALASASSATLVKNSMAAMKSSACQSLRRRVASSLNRQPASAANCCLASAGVNFSTPPSQAMQCAAASCVASCGIMGELLHPTVKRQETCDCRRRLPSPIVLPNPENRRRESPPTDWKIGERIKPSRPFASP